MEWTVVMVIIALAGLIGTVAVPLSKNTKAMTQLTERLGFLTQRMDAEEDALDTFKEKAAKKHNMIFDRLNDHENTLIGHEQRIYNLENHKEEKK